MNERFTKYLVRKRRPEVVRDLTAPYNGEALFTQMRRYANQEDFRFGADGKLSIPELDETPTMPPTTDRRTRTLRGVQNLYPRLAPEDQASFRDFVVSEIPTEKERALPWGASVERTSVQHASPIPEPRRDSEPIDPQEVPITEPVEPEKQDPDPESLPVPPAPRKPVDLFVSTHSQGHVLPDGGRVPPYASSIAFYGCDDADILDNVHEL